MRSGGDFAKGPNSAGISGSTGSGSTFAADPHGGGKVTTYDGKKPESRTAEALGKPADDVKRKTGQTGTLGGGKQTQQAALGGGIGPHGKGTQTEMEHDSGARGSTHSAGSHGKHTSTSDAKKKGDAGSHAKSHGGGGGGGAGAVGGGGSSHGGKEAPLNTSTNPNAFSGLGVKQTGKVGESAEDVDWSKISKDTNTTTAMGSEEDPAREADLNMRKKAMHLGGDNTGEEGNSFGGLGEESLD